jgi:hypothetical protein
MDRHKALIVLREVLDVLEQAIDLKSITVGENSDGSYFLMLQCLLDNIAKQSLQPILDKNSLELKEENNCQIIY